MMGFVVGFSGSKIFCLHVYSMTTIEVPLSAAMYQYLDKKDLGLAYETACLGVTETDWEAIGKAALEVLDMDTARRAFARLKDLRWVQKIFIHRSGLQLLPLFRSFANCNLLFQVFGADQ